MSSRIVNFCSTSESKIKLLECLLNVRGYRSKTVRCAILQLAVLVDVISYEQWKALDAVRKLSAAKDDINVTDILGMRRFDLTV